jgi:hypothetical protein
MYTFQFVRDDDIYFDKETDLSWWVLKNGVFKHQNNDFDNQSNAF